MDGRTEKQQGIREYLSTGRALVKPFEFATAARIVFGPGKAGGLATMVREFGTRALLVTGRNTERANFLLDQLESAGIQSSVFPTAGEPTVDLVRKGSQAARGCKFVIGFGGGSAVDAAKAIAALAPNSGEPLDYLEVVGKGRPLENTPMPLVAVPTTAGTGAEVTRNAVLDSVEHGVKASLRSPLMLAKLALIDPLLTFDLPPHVTASTGLDTLTQLIEPYVGCRANPFTHMFCREGMQRVSTSLLRVFRDSGDREARESMSFASLLSGLALANAGLGVVHGFAAPLGGLLHAPHGALCAAVLPHGMAVNIRALEQRARENESLSRYRDVARILTGNSRAEPADGAEWADSLSEQLSIPSLGAYGLARHQIPDLVEKATHSNSMKGNPIALTKQELTEIAELSL